jgi:hypothetical protein
MMARWFDCDVGAGVRNAAAVAACLLLTVCASPPATTTTNWIRTGADDATVSREVADCRAQANAAVRNQQGINQDISATLGRNWQMSQTTGIEDQSMRQDAAAAATQTFNSCMRAKGFKKES